MSEAADGAGFPDGTPMRLGRYRLVRPISTGGMAHVFEARRDSIAGVSPRVAIKVILPHFAADLGFRELFVNEARVGSLLHHQNLVQIQDFDSEGDRYFIVMEYVEGFTLRRAISLYKRSGLRLSLSTVAEIGRQVCDGLHHAHAACSEGGQHLHLVHRDVKPSNLILNPQGVVKILDFGISKARILAEENGAVRGTWGYMGPEQADGLDVGPGADLFGLASVIYELAQFEPLFPEKDPFVIRRLLDEDQAARRASQLPSTFSPLIRVLVRALQRDPAARFPTAAAMGRAFGELVTDPVTAREEVVALHSSLATLSGGSAPERAKAAPHALRAPQTPAPVSTMAPRAGLPVVVGDGHRPHPSSPPASQATTFSWWAPMAATLFLVVAFAVVLFTASRVLLPRWSGRSESPTSPTSLVTAASTQDDAALTDPPPPATIAGPPVEGAVAQSPVPAPAREAAQSEQPMAEAENPRITPHPGAPAGVSLELTASQMPAPPGGDSESTAAVPVPNPSAPDADLPSSPSPAPSSPPAATAGVGATAAQGATSLTISSEPRAQVLIDGVFVRYTPLYRYRCEPGPHTVTLVVDDGRRTTFRLEVAEGEQLRRVWSFERGDFVSP